MPTKSKARTAPAAVAGKNGHSLISSEKFRQLYAALVKYELIEKRFGSPSEGGVTAGAVGITLDLKLEDTLVVGPRTFAANLIKGVPVRALLDYPNSSPFIYGAVNTLAPAGPSAARQAGLATGAALANKLAKNGNLAVAFIEGGATALAECKEALELASTHKLPALYVIHANADRKLDRLLTEMGETVTVVTVDAHDAVAVYRVAQESLARARDGDPSVIVCVPYLTNGTRPSALLNMEQYLTGKKLFRKQWKDEAIAELERELSSACHPKGNPLA